jgi:hypothetical protein
LVLTKDIARTSRRKSIDPSGRATKNSLRAVAEKTFRLEAMHIFRDFWTANFRLCIIGNMYFGFSYEETNPPLYILPWRRVSDVCKKLVKHLELVSDQSTLMFDDDCGRELPGHDCLSVDSNKGMIWLLDWARTNSSNETVCDEAIRRIDFLRGRSHRIDEAFDRFVAIMLFRVVMNDPDTDGVVTVIALPFNFW